MSTGKSRRRGAGLPDVFLAAEAYLKPTVGLLERAEPMPHRFSVDDLEGIFPAHQGEREDNGVGGCQVGQLPAAAAEAARVVLHGPRRLRYRRPIGCHILAQQGEPGETPVQKPGSGGIRRNEAAGEALEVAMEELGMLVSKQLGNTVLVVLKILILAGQKRLAELDSLILDYRGRRLQSIPDGGVLGEEVRDHLGCVT